MLQLSRLCTIFGIRSVLRRRRNTSLFHTQTVSWTKGDKNYTKQLVRFRPIANNNTLLEAYNVDDTTSSKTAYSHIRNGEAVVYNNGDYHNARQLLYALKRKIKRQNHMRKDDHKEQEETHTVDWLKKQKHQEVVHKLLIEISIDEENSMPSQMIGLKRAPTNVKEILSFVFQSKKDMIRDKLGSDTSFLLPLSDFLGMNGSYEWYRKGLYIFALQDYIYPHYSVFPPTRQDYIELLDNINSDIEKESTLMEIGIGTGVISLILLKQKKVTKVIGTDINPYAVACAIENVERFGYENQVDILQADMFPQTIDDKPIEQVDILFFNPPWRPLKKAKEVAGEEEQEKDNELTLLDQSVYDVDQNLLRRYLLNAQHYVKEDGQVYLLLSNLGILLNIFKEEDLYQMFTDGNLELVDQYTTSSFRKGKDMTKKSKSDPYDISGIKAQEVISLYKLRVKKVK